MICPAPLRLPIQAAGPPRRLAFFLCIVAAASALSASGCLRHKVHAAPVVAPIQPPVPVAASETTKSPAAIPAPNPPVPKNPEPATPPPELTPKPDALKRPVTIPPEQPERPPAPQISPQMSASDQAELAKQTQQYLANAQQNLHRADGRELNASQRDMVDKIRGFLEQAQEAIRTSDWSRAKPLSQKAYLLSLELLKTF